MQLSEFAIAVSQILADSKSVVEKPALALYPSVPNIHLYIIYSLPEKGGAYTNHIASAFNCFGIIR